MVRLVSAVLASMSFACGGSLSAPGAFSVAGQAERAPVAYGAPVPPPAAGGVMGPFAYADEATAPAAGAPELPGAERQAQVASDAVTAGPILIYSASFVLAVYEVERTQLSLKERARELGGFVSSQTDDRLVLRVPAGHFEQALLAVEGAGKVRSRNVEAADVGDEYRDLTLRLHTAELLRARLEAMLAKAERVSDALEVQAQIERLVREIEQLKGQLRSMGDRIAFSTIIVMFQPEARPDLDDSEVFKLPYPWLDELGLHNLLELAP